MRGDLSEDEEKSSLGSIEPGVGSGRPVTKAHGELVLADEGRNRRALDQVRGRSMEAAGRQLLLYLPI